jgi:predicted ATP-binding protein involved in virulence
MIRDSRATLNDNTSPHANAVDAELDNLRRSREFAVERQKKGQNVDALLAYYDEHIARLMALR